MLDAMPDNLILQDREARVVFLNRSSTEMASRMLGRPPDQLVGVSVLDALPAGPFRDYIASISKRVAAGETVREEFLMPGTSGTEWREHYLAPVLRADGEIEGIAIASRNIHASKPKVACSCSRRSRR
jgi:PAS domain S-box-containing protein